MKQMSLMPVAILFFSFFTSVVFATTYYVDSKNGKDSNNGLSPNLAWKTIARVNSTMYSPGDLILFKRGEIWREQLTNNSSGTKSSPILFGAYGKGGRPVINGANIILDWSESGQSNVWQAALDKEPGGVFFDRKPGAQTKRLERVDREYEWFWNNQVLYVYSTTDPDVAFTTPGVEASVREFCIKSVSQSNLVFKSFELKYAANYGIQCNYEITNVVLDSIHAHHNGLETSGFGIDVQGGNNIIIRNCESNNSGWNGIAMSSWGSTSDKSRWLIEHSVSHDNVHSGFDINTGTPGINISDVTIRYCESYNNSAGIYVEGEQGERISNVKIHYNITYSNDKMGIFIQSFSENPPFPDKVEIFNNVMYDNGHEAGTFGMGLLALMTNGVVKNNIIFNNEATDSFEREFKIWDGGGGKNTFDYNIVFHPTHKNLAGWDNEIFTYDNFLQQGHNSHGFNQDPVLTDPQRFIFTPQSGSPAINSGDDVGLNRDFRGMPVPEGNAVDIGAYEFGEAVDITPPSPPRNVHVEIPPNN